MTGKQRAYWRAQANGLEPLFQSGKGGVSEALIVQTRDALRARELIKIRVLLETTPQTPKEIANELAAATESEIIQVIGGSIVLYKYNEELHKKDGKKR